MGGNVVVCSWGTPEWDGGAPLLGYTVAIRDVTKTMWMEVGQVGVHTLQYNVRDLGEDRLYMVRVYARNEVGASEPLESDEPVRIIPGEGNFFLYQLSVDKPNSIPYQLVYVYVVYQVI